MNSKNDEEENEGNKNAVILNDEMRGLKMMRK